MPDQQNRTTSPNAPSGSSKRRRVSLRPEDRRSMLLDAAKRVFLERGYEGARVSDIVEAASIAQGTFYLYFDSKESAFLALTGQSTKAQLDRIARWLAIDDPIGITLDHCVRASFEHAFAERAFLRLINTTPVRAQVQNQTSSLNADILQAARLRIQREQARGGIDTTINPSVAAVMLAGALDWATYSFAVYVDRKPSRATIAQAAAILRNALNPPQDTR